MSHGSLSPANVTSRASLKSTFSPAFTALSFNQGLDVTLCRPLLWPVHWASSPTPRGMYASVSQPTHPTKLMTHPPPPALPVFTSPCCLLLSGAHTLSLILPDPLPCTPGHPPIFTQSPLSLPRVGGQPLIWGSSVPCSPAQTVVCLPFPSTLKVEAIPPRS